MKTLRIAPMLAAIAFLSGALLVASPTKALAADACYNSPSKSTCDGDDPQTSGCAADAYTVQTKTVTDQSGGGLGTLGYVDLRYSPHCGTNWARLRPTSTSNPPAEYYAAVYRPSDGAIRTVDTYSTSIVTVWSPMLYARSVCAKGNGYINLSGGAWGDIWTDCI